MKYLCETPYNLMEECRKVYCNLKDDIIDMIENYEEGDDPTSLAIDVYTFVDATQHIEDVMYSIETNKYNNFIMINEDQYDAITFYGRNSVPKELFVEIVEA